MVLRCGDCGHLYAERPAPGQGMPPMADAAAECRIFAERNRRLVRRWQRDGFLFGGARVIDVGAGPGHISQAIRDGVAGARLYCLEPESDAAAFLAQRGLTVVDSIKGLDRVDAILLIEVIEHVDDPVGLLKECHAALVPGGRIFLTTPCGETPSGRRPKIGYSIPEHIHFFTERSLRRACDKAGLYNIRFVNPDVMHPHDGMVSLAKALLRPLRDMVTGRQHLVCYVD